LSLTRTHVRTSLRKYHIWLGWLIGVPMLFWTLSGVVMVWKPIDEVRGSKLLADPAPVVLATPAIAPTIPGSFTSLTLEPRANGPRWVIKSASGSRLADPVTGRFLPALTAADAAREVRSRYRSSAAIASVTRTDAAHAPLDLRRDIASWQVTMSDGTHFYVDTGSGAIVATRTKFWRFYDWMWGLHIMDLQGRENTHNPWIVGFGILTLVTTVLALALLPLTSRRRRKR